MWKSGDGENHKTFLTRAWLCWTSNLFPVKSTWTEDLSCMWRWMRHIKVFCNCNIYIGHRTDNYKYKSQYWTKVHIKINETLNKVFSVSTIDNRLWYFASCSDTFWFLVPGADLWQVADSVKLLAKFLHYPFTWPKLLSLHRADLNWLFTLHLG